MANPLMRESQTPASSLSAVHTGTSQVFSLRTRLGRFVWFAVLLTLLFSKALIALVMHISNSNLHSYILLVPFISAYLIYIRRDQLPSTTVLPQSWLQSRCLSGWLPWLWRSVLECLLATRKPKVAVLASEKGLEHRFS